MRWRTRVHQSVSRGGGDVQRVSLHHIMLDSQPGQGLRPNHISQWTGWQTAASVTCTSHSSTQEDEKNAPSSRPIATFSDSSGGSMLRTSWMWTPWRRFTALFMTEQGQYGGHQIQPVGAGPSDHPLVDGWMMTSMCIFYHLKKCGNAMIDMSGRRIRTRKKMAPTSCLLEMTPSDVRARI